MPKVTLWSPALPCHVHVGLYVGSHILLTLVTPAPTSLGQGEPGYLHLPRATWGLREALAGWCDSTSHPWAIPSPNPQVHRLVMGVAPGTCGSSWLCDAGQSASLPWASVCASNQDEDAHSTLHLPPAQSSGGR